MALKKNQENLYIYNISMTNASDGARIKVWPGAIPNSNVTNAGGGTGYVRNVTYNGMHDVNDDCESSRIRRKEGRLC
jgi:galacturan 1,4-alpha-galacturonidase